ncbi:YtpR family tRNA-binding protein [Williamsoniiplasma lucivorax]|uniref:tRNA-binding domain-containing protein n=1 Tax=Williamsoniiplasma lucivorax TaxID=209274 RepID=A0A2S5RFP7_9MOLU|nr:hypothetical protein [Williamsoniiplasma lucivorax]PPE06133.1 hypothetical protein ELUCI_v1c04240 [Williamsoniiplasma lucivorax]
MEKKYGIFYNVEFDTLLITLEKPSSHPEIETKGNITIIKSGDEITGFNIANISDEIVFTPGLISETRKAINFVEQQLRNIYPLTQLPQFVICQVLEIQPIEGTQLKACKVQNNDGVVDVVTAAKNVAVGTLTVMATDGTWLPNGNVIHSGMMRGYPTVGMFCSVNELNFRDKDFNEEGVIILDQSYQAHVGASFWGVYETRQ